MFTTAARWLGVVPLGGSREEATGALDGAGSTRERLKMVLGNSRPPSPPNRGPASCDAVGHTRGGLHPSLGHPFREAYERAGGKERVGCPRSDDPSGFVGPWGPGWRQDLRG